MAASDGFPTVIVVSFCSFYSVVFLLSIIGNSFVLSVCYKTLKRQKSSLKMFIANLAFSDLSFTVLSILDLIAFLWAWIGGQVSCKLQSFLIEACYTTSITTLLLISFERRKAVVAPFSARMSAPDVTYKKLVAVWVVSFVVGSPLLYAYQLTQDGGGMVTCTNATFGDLGRQIYYSIHAVFMFIVPLAYMIYAQSSIFFTLRSGVFPMQNAFSTAVYSRRHRKVAKQLTALTIAFAICWSPFIVVRTLMYFQLTEGGYYWRASQLLIFLNTALDPILYGIYGNDIKVDLQRVFMCTNFLSDRVESFTTKRKIRRNKRDSSTTVRSKNAKVDDLNIEELTSARVDFDRL